MAAAGMRRAVGGGGWEAHAFNSAAVVQASAGPSPGGVGKRGGAERGSRRESRRRHSEGGRRRGGAGARGAIRDVTGGERDSTGT